ncbi:MAG: HlyD family type I secretion periplasmic adaptor subunit [Pseudomonadota bacterium]
MSTVNIKKRLIRSVDGLKQAWFRLQRSGGQWLATAPAESGEGLSARALEATAMAEPNVLAMWILRATALLLFIFLLWASLFEIDIRVRGTGKVIPVSQVQQIQNLEGGIVTEIAVAEGDVVQKGQILLKLSAKQAEGELTEKKVTAEGLTAAIARLTAEAEGSQPLYPPHLKEKYPELIQAEESLRQQRALTLSAQMQIFKNQRSQKASELASFRGRIPQTRASLRLTQEQIALVAPLVRDGAAAPTELNNLRREEANAQNQLIQVEQGAIAAEAALAEAQQRIAEKESIFRSEARDELAKKSVQLAAIQGGVDAKSDQVSRTELVSPVRGIVKTLYITTVGGVAPPGRTIMDIVPLEDNLLVEAKISPSDIAWIRPGLKAQVRITAFDSAIFGGLDGEVVHIAPDSVLDERRDLSYYRVQIRIKAVEVQGPAGALAIVPGMVADADILTGKRTVMDYFLKPIVRGLSIAMSER